MSTISVASTSGAAPSAIIRDSSLVLYLDAALSQSYSGSGTSWNDISGSGNVLTLTGTPTFNTSGFFNFNGSSQYARTTTLPTTATTNFSMCAWINPSNINQLAMVINNGRDDGINTPYNGYAMGVGSGTGATGAKFQALASAIAWIDTGYTYPSASAWYNIVMTRDTSTFYFYVNGVQTASTSASVPVAPTANFSVGAAFGVSAARYFAGSIASVMVYTKQLSLAEILQNYNAGRSRYGI